MGRVKIAMEFISKEKARNNTFVKRKRGLLKKGLELSILCEVPVCFIIYPYKGKQQQQQQPQPQPPEVYAFKGDAKTGLKLLSDDDLGSNEVVRDPKIAWEIIDRFLRAPNEEKNKKSRCVNLYDMFDDWTKKADQELTKLRRKNGLLKYPSCNHSVLNDFSVDQLVELLVHLDHKIEFVNQRIGMINHNQEGEVTTTATATPTPTTGLLVPYFEPTPISSFMMNPSENNGHHNHYQLGCPEFEGFNQFPLFNYPMINSNDDTNQEYFHQIMPFTPQNALFPPPPPHHHHHQVVGATKMEDHGGSSGNNNVVMYNNLMGGVVPIYYNQRPGGFVDNVGATSSYGGGGGGGFPMTMPLQLPMLQQPPNNNNNVFLPKQRQFHQIFYK